MSSALRDFATRRQSLTPPHPPPLSSLCLMLCACGSRSDGGEVRAATAQLLTLISRRSRLLSFYPLAAEQQTAEALSPVLGHLIDLALAVIELERSTIISPFAVRCART